MKWFLKNKYTYALFAILGSVVFSAFLAALFSIIGGNFWRLVQIVYLWFGAPLTVAGLLILLLNFKEELSYGYGCALYYGSALIASLLNKWFDITFKTSYIIAFVIVALLSYIFWLKHHKEKEEN